MPTSQDDTLLIFRIDRIACAVPAGSVLSIAMPPPQLTQPPGSDRGRPGIFRHAGHIYAVVDLHQRFGIETPRKGPGRLLLHEQGVRRHALWVDEVVGLVRSEEGQWATMPPYLPHTLFQRGFLHHKEIVLCSTLEVLLAMRDAGPIRLHLQHLAQRDEGLRAESGKEVPHAPHQEEKAPAAASGKMPLPKSEPPPVTAPRNPTPPTAATHPTPAPVQKERVVTTATPSARGTAVARPAVPAPFPAVKLPPPTNPPRPTPLPQHEAVLPAHTPPSNRGKAQGHWLFWSVLVLLLTTLSAVAIYRLLAGDEPAMTPRPTTARYIPLPSRPEPEAQPPLPMEAPATKPTLQNVHVTPAAEPAPKISNDTVSTGRPAIQIEQDEEGTISLIIERSQLRNPPPSLPAPRAAAAPHDGLTKDPALTAPLTGPGDAARTEEPLLPDSDWPVPETLPEPCDCTHIVVKGDTLWDIAQKYTNNAFNYPELARQSGIRNPHRIYPGNKVRIIVR